MVKVISVVPIAASAGSITCDDGCNGRGIVRLKIYLLWQRTEGVMSKDGPDVYVLGTTHLSLASPISYYIVGYREYVKDHAWLADICAVRICLGFD